MATRDEVVKLAALARVGVSETEIDAFTREFDAILGYMGQLEALEVSVTPGAVPLLHNVMRADGEPHATGEYTERIASQFPARKGDALSVKQIICHD